MIKDFYGENGNTLNDLNKWRTIPNLWIDGNQDGKKITSRFLYPLLEHFYPPLKSNSKHTNCYTPPCESEHVTD